MTVSASGSETEDSSGRACPARLTAALTRQGDRWTIVHSHASIGVPDEAMFD